MVDKSPIPILQVDHFAPLFLGEKWQVAQVGDAEEAVAALPDGFAMLLIRSNADSAATVAAIRGSGLPVAAVPIVVFGVGNEAAVPGADLCLPDLSDPDLAEALTDWRPVPLPEAYGRLEATFGVEAVRGMAARLSEVLAKALDALDTSGVAEEAHRVAGVAGTLGFGELGKQWLALSHDPTTFPPNLRRDTRRTIAAILLRINARS